MDQLSPEDREMLAKTKFKQWFQECFDESFGVSFDGRLSEYAKLSGGNEGSTTTTTTPKTDETKPTTKRRSLLEVALSDVMGI